jgi:hypothetical protein
VTFTTAGSDFDTLLAVYLGDRLEDLKEVASNDDIGDRDGSGDVTSAVRFLVTEQETYRIAVDGHDDASGTLVLSWRYSGRVPNDRFADALRIEGAEGRTEIDTTLATREHGEPDHAGRPGGRSVWYRWRPPRRGWYSFDTAGSDFDTLLAIYVGYDLARLQVVGENDDVAYFDRTSRVVFRAETTDDYAIAVDGYKGQSGALVLRWSRASWRRMLWEELKLLRSSPASPASFDVVGDDG